MRTYNELSKLNTFMERYEYLRLNGVVGQSTFGHARHVNQSFYKSERWLKTRDKVIIRDNGCDLGIEGHEIYDMIIVHHINPVTLEDIENDSNILYDMNNLICVTDSTHKAIHFSDKNQLHMGPTVRSKNDTIPWR